MGEKFNICFDLDGPIIDVSARYYVAYLESLKGTHTTKEQILTLEDFWKLRRNRISELEIGILSGLNISESLGLVELRKELSFKDEFFSYDKLFNDVYKAFENLKAKNIIFFIVTLRRHKQLTQAIKQFKLDKYLGTEFFFSLPDEHKITNDIQEKCMLLVKAINFLNLNPLETLMIGDSDTDIHAARLARFQKVIAISRGIRSKEQLEILKPDHLIANLSELSSLSTNI
ncbi:MAG: HAD family hydrolase [Candidatus Melainabacteria bacterium]|nr:HAD family hydrolase [Candidatus Melainabacteria bacterium]